MSDIGFNDGQCPVDKLVFRRDPFEECLAQCVNRWRIDVDAEDMIANNGQPPRGSFERIALIAQRVVNTGAKIISPAQFVKDFQQKRTIAAGGVEDAAAWRGSPILRTSLPAEKSVKARARHPSGNCKRSVYAAELPAGHGKLRGRSHFNRPA
jgi:hypothetical protein